MATFDSFVAAFAGGIDGLWSSTIKEVAIVAGVETFQLSAKTFRDYRGGGPGVHESRGLRHVALRRLVDEQAHAGEGGAHSASHPVPHGAQSMMGGAGGNADGGFARTGARSG